MDEVNDILVDQAAAALRNLQVPEGPSVTLLAATLAKVQKLDTQFVQKRRNMKRIWTLAASIVLLLGLSILSIWLFTGNGGNMAFADVINQVKLVRSAEFRMTGTIVFPDQRTQKYVMHVIMADPARVRIEYIEGDVMVGTISVYDYHTHKNLTLMPAQKTAMAQDLELGPKKSKQLEQINIIDEMRTWNSDASKPVGKRQIHGRPASGFRTSQPGFGESTVWADDQTRLPVEIEGKMQADGLPKVTVVYTDFLWDQQIDETLLSTTPPVGYEVQKSKFDLSEPTYKDLVEGLRTFGEFNNGAFPDQFSLAGLVPVIPVAMVKFMPAQAAMPPGISPIGTPGTAPAPLTAEQKKAVGEMFSKGMMQISRGLTFAGNQKYGTDWHYAGKGVALGEAGRPVVWYRPAGKETYRLIDGALAVRDIPAAEVPTVPSVILDTKTGLAVPETQPAPAITAPQP